MKWLTKHYSKKKLGTLSLNGLTDISDKQAEYIANHNGTVYLEGLISVTKEQVMLLAKHKGLIFTPKEIRQQINKYKQHEYI